MLLWTIKSLYLILTDTLISLVVKNFFQTTVNSGQLIIFLKKISLNLKFWECLMKEK